MEQADLLNPTDDQLRFWGKINKLKNLDTSAKKYLNDKMYSKSLYRPFECDT